MKGAAVLLNLITVKALSERSIFRKSTKTKEVRQTHNALKYRIFPGIFDRAQHNFDNLSSKNCIMPHAINITGSNTSTHLLTLSDNGHTRADKGARVTWNVLDPNVVSIKIIEKGGPVDIWSQSPRPQPGSKDWMGVIHPRARDNARYSYLIRCERPTGVFHDHDPMISIKPRPIDDRVTAVLVVGGAIAAMFLARAFFGKNRHRKFK